MAYMNNDRGPLVPGQTISVNKYTIQIERYLSKGASIILLYDDTERNR